MAPNKKLTFEVMVKRSMFITLPIPKRINQLVNTPNIKARRADDSQWYNLSRVYIMFGDKEEIHWGHGWDKFMEKQNIQLHDKLEMTYEGCKCFCVKVFRGGRVVPKASESDVILLSSGSSSDFYRTDTGSQSDGSSSESVWSKSESSGRSSDFAGTHSDGIREEQPAFRATFTQPYLKVNRLNVPLGFAKTHLASLGPENDADVFMNYKEYEVKLFVKREGNRIALCNMKGEGIKKMIKEQKISKGQQVEVNMLCKTPPVFKVRRI